MSRTTIIVNENRIESYGLHNYVIQAKHGRQIEVVGADDELASRILDLVDDHVAQWNATSDAAKHHRLGELFYAKMKRLEKIVTLKKDGRKLASKYKGRCAICGCEVCKGDVVFWARGIGVAHPDCLKI